ncbi:hypothetical protein KAR34_02690 [bacterium]|nr:hypothetical protein [bacterium]
MKIYLYLIYIIPAICAITPKTLDLLFGIFGFSRGIGSFFEYFVRIIFVLSLVALIFIYIKLMLSGKPPDLGIKIIIIGISIAFYIISVLINFLYIVRAIV